MKEAFYNEEYNNQLSKNLRVSKSQYAVKPKFFSDHKRRLVSDGLPILFTTKDHQTYGQIDVDDKGGLVLKYNCIKAKILDTPNSVYLIDVDDDYFNTLTFSR